MFFQRLGRVLIAHRAWILLALSAITVLAARQIPDLRYDMRADTLLAFSEDERAFAEDVKDRYGTQDHTLLVVVHSASGQPITSPDGLTLLHRLTEQLETLPGVTSSYSLTRVPRPDLSLNTLTSGTPAPLITELPIRHDDAARVRDVVETSHVLKGQLVSDDLSTASVMLVIDDTLRDPRAFDPVLAQLEDAAADLVNESDAAFDIHFGGLPYVRTATVRKMQDEQLILWPGVAAVYFIVMWVIFRRVRHAVLPLLVVGIATLWTMGLMAAFDVPIDMLNNTMPTLILVIGVTNSVHIAARIFEERHAGAPVITAIRRAMVRVGMASLLTTLTAAIGFASLIVAPSDPLTVFGLLVATGIMLAYITMVTLLPILLSYAMPKTTHELPGPHRGQQLERILEAFTHTVSRRPRTVVAAACVLLVATAGIGAQLPVDANVMETFPDDHPVAVANQLIEHKLGGILPLDVDLRAKPGTFETTDTLAHVAAFEDDVRELEGVLSVIALPDLLAESGMVGPDGERSAMALSMIRHMQPEAIERLATDDMSGMRVMVRLGERGVRKNLETLNAIEALSDQHLHLATDADIEVRQTGVAYLSARGLDTFVRGLFYSLLTATVIIFFVTMIAFQSWRVACVSLLPNLLPLGITLALMPVYGFALNTTTAIVFTITIGLAVDNTIHLVARYREERQRGVAVDDAIQRAGCRAGRAIVLSNLLLVAGFGVLMLTRFVPIRTVALLTMTTIIASMLTALITVPAQLTLIGDALFKRPKQVTPSRATLNSRGPGELYGALGE